MRFNARLVSSILVVLALGERSNALQQHMMEKRQVGVLARSGALPQGKRSVEALARNGELPITGNDKRDIADDLVLDQLIRELGTAEGLSRLRVQAIAERLQNEKDAETTDYEDIGKRSLSALARNSDLPQKRVVTNRAGYIVRTPHDVAVEESDLLDPDAFLGKTGVDVLALNGGFGPADGRSAFARHDEEEVEDVDEGNEDEDGYFDEYYETGKGSDLKRHVGAARNFFSAGKTTVGSRGYMPYGGRGKKNLASFRNFGKRTVGAALNFGKRHVGAARNFLLSDKRNLAAFKNFMSSYNNKRNVGAARNFLLGESKRNVGAAKNFLGKRNLASFARDGGFASLKYPPMKDYDWDDFIDFDDFHDEEERKRNVGSFKNFGKRSTDGKGDGKSLLSAAVVSSTVGDAVANNKTRTKRETSGYVSEAEYPMPVLQASREFDYGDDDPSDVQKRFLGSVASLSPKEEVDEEEDYSGVTKRHIGALARLGWLPSFRTTRYSRSGRAINTRNNSPFRPDSSIGSCPSEDAIPFWSPQTPAQTKVAVSSQGIFRRVGRSLPIPFDQGY